MDFEKGEWKMLVRKLIDQFDSDSVGYSSKKFVEMVGVQVHTLRETGKLHFVFGPDCAFKNLAVDQNPTGMSTSIIFICFRIISGHDGSRSFCTELIIKSSSLLFYLFPL